MYWLVNNRIGDGFDWKQNQVYLIRDHELKSKQRRRRLENDDGVEERKIKRTKEWKGGFVLALSESFLSLPFPLSPTPYVYLSLSLSLSLFLSLSRLCGCLSLPLLYIIFNYEVSKVCHIFDDKFKYYWSNFVWKI